MPRRMTPAPANVAVFKTSRGSWVAVEEVWDGEQLMELHPLRSPGPDDGILQAHERREMLATVEYAALQAENRTLRKRLKDIEGRMAERIGGGPEGRYAATG